MNEQKDIKTQTRKLKLGRRGKGGGMTPKQENVDFIVDPKTGTKIFIRKLDVTPVPSIEMGKDGIQTVDMKAKGGRAMLRGGGICKKGMNRKAVGKNS